MNKPKNRHRNLRSLMREASADFAPVPARQPAPDVAGLVEALVACARASSAAEVGLIVDAALAAHRKQGGEV